MGYNVVKSRTTPVKQSLTIGSVLGWLGRMILPVSLLALSLILAYSFLPVNSTLLDGLFPTDPLPGSWLTQGHVLVCLSFLVIHLTNRAYGPNFAAAQVILTWSLLGAGAYWLLAAAQPETQAGVPSAWLSGLPDASTIATFVVALGIGQLVSVLTFDLTRGPRWWTAPLWGSAIGMAAFVAIFYLARTGIEPNWLARFGVDLSLKLAMAAFLLVPYYLLRTAIRPQPGYGGA